ncbi:MAG TPA: tryptophan-rich sensory protein [Candidatus Woesebacteria bacterium]|nr:tryptophan-rich sensory protein [Candidatus Woesebacteria bacterium]
MNIKIVPLITSIGVSLLAGIIGSIFTFESIPTWYASINKPFFTPPNWIFGPVWTALYILMGITLYLTWESKPAKVRTYAIYFFFVQLVLNTIWSILFFGLKWPFGAFIEIVLLLSFIILTAFYMYKVNKLSGYLLIPYICWVTFASLLNFAILMLN